MLWNIKIWKKKSLYSLNYTNNKKKEVSRTTTIILNSLLAHFSKLKVDVHLVLKKNSMTEHLKYTNVSCTRFLHTVNSCPKIIYLGKICLCKKNNLIYLHSSPKAGQENLLNFYIDCPFEDCYDMPNKMQPDWLVWWCHLASVSKRLCRNSIIFSPLLWTIKVLETP